MQRKGSEIAEFLDSSLGHGDYFTNIKSEKRERVETKYGEEREWKKKTDNARCRIDCSRRKCLSSRMEMCAYVPAGPKVQSTLLARVDTREMDRDRQNMLDWSMLD